MEWVLLRRQDFTSGGSEQRLVKRPIDASESLKPCLRPPEAAVFIMPHISKELTEKKMTQANVPCVEIFFQPHKRGASWGVSVNGEIRKSHFRHRADMLSLVILHVITMHFFTVCLSFTAIHFNLIRIIRIRPYSLLKFSSIVPLVTVCNCTKNHARSCSIY